VFELRPSAPEISVAQHSQTTRRAVLGAGLGAAIATIASALGRPQAALGATGDPVIAGSTVAASGMTLLVSTEPTDEGLRVVNVSSGGAYSGDAEQGPTFLATNLAGNAFDGTSKTGIGAKGWSDSGVGVSGRSNSGIGVEALGPGSATALSVQGRATFSRSGKALLPKGRTFVDVEVGGGLSPSSLVVATLMLNCVGVYVPSAVPNPAAGTVRIYVNKVASSASSTPIAWFVLTELLPPCG
jgi:hypothetical protein